MQIYPFFLKISRTPPPALLFLECNFHFSQNKTSKSCLNVTNLLFSSAFGLFRFLKTSKRAKLTPYIGTWILVAENMTDPLLWFTNDTYHCRKEHWSYFPLFLNLPCFDLPNFYATQMQSIVTKMLLNVHISRFLIKKVFVCKNQSNNILTDFSWFWTWNIWNSLWFQFVL